MTVTELIQLLLKCPPAAEVRVTLDVSDHDTTWELYGLRQTPLVVVLEAK